MRTVNGNFYATEVGQLKKKLLTVMWKPVAGKYLDIFLWQQFLTLMYANIFFEVWNNLISVTNIALDVILTMKDAHSGNISFFN